MRRISLLSLLIYTIFVCIAISCAPKEGSLFYGALGVGESRVILSSSNGLNQNITMYDGQGNFKSLLADYNISGGTPRGFAHFDGICFLAAIEGLDQIEKLCLDGRPKSIWGKNVQVLAFNGILKLPNKQVLAIDANTIELFDSNGVRVPPTGTVPYINTTIGGCTLATPTRMVLNENDQLLVANPGNERINIYNISTPTPTCVTSVNFGTTAQDPQALLAHSNGSIYVATIVNTNETIWRTNSLAGSPTAIFQNQITIIQDPNALAELPNGNILVSSFGTDSIVELDENGNFVKIFAKNSNTIDVFDILVITGGSPP